MPQTDDEKRDDLAATSESLKDDARQLSRIEDEKQQLDADDPRLNDLSRDAERIAGQVQEKSRVERALAEDLGDGPEHPERPAH